MGQNLLQACPGTVEATLIFQATAPESGPKRMNLMESTTSGAWMVKRCSTPMNEGLIGAAAAAIAALANDAVVFNATDTRSDTRFDGRLVGLVIVDAKRTPPALRTNQAGSRTSL